MAAAPPPPPRWFPGALIGAGLLGVVGSALPWVTMSGTNADAITLFLQSKGGGLGGLDHGGAVTVVLAGMAVAFGVARLLGRAPRAALVGVALGAAMAVVVVEAVLGASGLADTFEDAAAGLEVGNGVGTWVTAASAAILVMASTLALRSGAPGSGQPGASSSPSSSSSTSSTDSMIPVMASTTEANRAIDT